MYTKEDFELAAKGIHRDGIDKLMKYLAGSDFYEAPASTKYHGSYEGGLVNHSMNVYTMLISLVHALKTTLDLAWDDETLLIVALFHDLCKVGCYHKSFRNTKDKDGKWIQVPTYTYDDQNPYGHGEKSTRIVEMFMKLSSEEAYAIRYHMGFSVDDPKSNVGKAFELYPLAIFLHFADQLATSMLDSKEGSSEVQK